MVRATVFVYLAWTAALVTPQDDLHYNTIIVDIIRHQELGIGVNLGDIPQSRDQESKVDDDIFADAEFDHEYEDDDKAAASTLAPSPQSDNVDRKHLNIAEVAKAERLAALVKNAPKAPIAEEDTDDGESNDNDDDENENDDVGDKVDGDEPPRGNVPAAVDDAPIHAASVGAASPDHNVSSPTASPSPFGIIGITLGCVATVCAVVGVYRSRRQAATQFSSESTLYMDDIRLRESEVTRY
ncbi:hypothetical protein DYB34_005626 [Aphanomyces astaci]|uniref:Uncharacterized protein n=1 Tax=Aphanomyces astaci TaxID=112090 RepID=A0A3R6YR31_APHAT|nr:hypothetical protein DYB34_005626 [Aphanomyces astaci]